MKDAFLTSRVLTFIQVLWYGLAGNLTSRMVWASSHPIHQQHHQVVAGTTFELHY